MIHGQVSQNLSVQFNPRLVHLAHELRVGHSVQSRSGIYALDPKGTKGALLVSAVPVGVLKSFFDGVLGYRPYILSSSKGALGQFENFFSAGSRGNMIDRSWHVLICF
jgi:hypothetical protein